jgi:hypothetical protein
MGRVIAFTTVSRPDEIGQILALQAANLPSALTPDTLASQGFVTVRHERDVLERMCAVAPAVIAKDEDRVVGYALVMPRAFAPDVPVLLPLFALLDTLSWQGQPLRDHGRWFVMGQICVAAGYRGRGIVDGMYRCMADVYRDRYDVTLTEIAARNTRSLRAHARVGFDTLQRYVDPVTAERWDVVALDLRGTDTPPAR